MNAEKQANAKWRVLIGAALYQCALLGTLYNTRSVLISQVKAELGLPLVAFSMYHAISGISGVIFGVILIKLFFQINKKIFLTGNILVLVSSYMLWLLGPGTWIWYASAVLGGMSFCTGGIVIPCILDQWFPKRSGSAVGFAMSFSGLGGIVFNMLAAWLIERFNWQMEIMVLCAITLALLAAGLWLMFPSSAPAEAPAEDAKAPGKKAKTVSDPAHKFPLLLVVVCSFTTFGGWIVSVFMQNVGVFARSIGFSLAAGAALNSAVMAGNVLSKFLLGIACDRFGTWRTIGGATVLVIISILCFLFLPSCVPAMYLAALLFGFDLGLVMIAPSRCAKSAYGKDMERYCGIHTSVNSAVSMVSSLGLGVLYDTSGTFSSYFVICLVGCAISVAACVMMRGLCRKTAEAA